MINPNQNIINPIGVTQAQNIQTAPNNLKQPVPNLSSAANNIISNNINKDISQSPMDLFGRQKVKGLGKKDKAPKVGIIDAPPYNKTPITNELNKLEAQTPKEKNKRPKPTNISFFLMLGIAAMGAFLFFSQISKPISSLIKKIHK